MSSQVEVDLDGLSDFLTKIGNSPAIEHTLEAIAVEVAAEARKTAPYSDNSSPGHQHYRDSITVTTEKAKHRVVKRVVADVHHAIFVEARTGNLARALRKVKKSW